jgi:hypothetical protein
VLQVEGLTRESAPDVTDYGLAEDRGARFDGYAVIFTSIREDWDLTPYMPPGHVPAAVAGTELVMFSPQDELAASEAAMRENMQLRMQTGNGN